MGRRNIDRKPNKGFRMERPCWRELLFGASSGFFPADQQLEKVLDHLECTL